MLCRLNAARQLLPECTDAAASSMKDSPAPGKAGSTSFENLLATRIVVSTLYHKLPLIAEPASSVAPQPPQQQPASPMVSEPGHPAENTDCLRDDAARMAATQNADHRPDSSNKEAVSSLVCRRLLVSQQT